MPRRRGRYLKAREEIITIIDPSDQYNQVNLGEFKAVYSIYAPTSRAHFETIKGFSQFDRVHLFTIDYVLPLTIIDECTVIRNQLLEEDETPMTLRSNRNKLRIITIQRANITSRIVCRDNET